MMTVEDTGKWKIVAIVSAILAVVMGQLVNGLSSFFTPLEQAFGWARGDIALINSAGLIGLAAGGIAMGLAADRFGVRRVAVAGVAVSAICFAVAGAAHTLWQLYAIFFLAGMFGGGAVFGPLVALTGRWFASGAGLALGLVAAGQAIGQGSVPYLNVILIEALGWRGAFVAFGAATALVLLPLAIMLKTPPAMSAAARAATEEPPLPARFAVTMMAVGVFWCWHADVYTADASSAPDRRMRHTLVPSGRCGLRDDDRGHRRPGGVWQTGRHDRSGAGLVCCFALADLFGFRLYPDRDTAAFLSVRAGLRLRLCGSDDRNPGDAESVDAGRDPIHFNWNRSGLGLDRSRVRRLCRWRTIRLDAGLYRRLRLRGSGRHGEYRDRR